MGPSFRRRGRSVCGGEGARGDRPRDIRPPEFSNPDGSMRCSELPERGPQSILMSAVTPVRFMLCLLVLAGGLAGVAWGRDNPRCDFCRKAISGRYMVYRSDAGELVLCRSCDAAYPHCSRCGLPFRESAVRKGGGILCPSCAREALTCSVCGTLIRGAYTVFSLENREYVVCPACKANAPRCEACSRPLASSEVIRSGPHIFCPLCDATLPNCESCGEKIAGTRFLMKFRDGEFCETCWKTRPVCAMCGAPCGKEYARLDDGRDLCGPCAQSAVTDPETVQKILAAVQPYLEKELGKPLDHPLTLRLVGPSELDQGPPGFPRGDARMAESDAAEVRNPAGPICRVDLDEGRGAGEKELGKFIRRGNRFEILILSGQPEAWAWETVAHEFAHAWQSKYNPKLNDLAWEEGFAQWAAELVLHWRGEEKQLERLRLRSDFYGQAYRLVSRFEALRGKPAMINAVLIMKNKPLKRD